ncbi:ATP-grasp domain-containing protein [Amycolatopsis jejuensis]|uniref:ATP-grasp domain-containing protein n=1 Tax=Amycolatopsis jejuensis TaxID=330084 RepID=UPI000526DA56|nr:ATP-grasp domain-containing protein [Amycolatopsis jejuensis]
MTQLLEHEAKTLLAAEGIPCPPGTVVTTAAEAAEAARRLGDRVAVKAQVPIGGRGKAGGVRIVAAGEVAAVADELFSVEVRGFRAAELMVEQALDSRRELYLALLADARTRAPMLLLGAEGGVDVEAGQSISQVPVRMSAGVLPSTVWRAAEELRLDAETATALVPIAQALWRVFRTSRAELVEINPLLDCPGRGLVAADARVVPDPALRPPPALDDLQRGSRALGFDLVVLDPAGRVGLLTTGAGASMLVADLLTAGGTPPYNFCDLRTGSFRGSTSRLDFALHAFASHAPQLRVIAVNVFAGVTDLDEFSELLLRALATNALPVVVRVEGRNADRARKRLADAGIQTAATVEDLVATAATYARKEA